MISSDETRVDMRSRSTLSPRRMDLPLGTCRWATSRSTRAGVGSSGFSSSYVHPLSLGSLTRSQLGAAFFALIYFFLPETRDTILMMKKAKRVREETGYEKIYALHEQDRASAGRLWKVSLVRPFKFLFYEPVSPSYPFFEFSPC